MTLELISFNLCPYVQRSVITLEEKQVDYEVRYIDLNDKPDWFLQISPFGKVPVLKVGDIALFESAVINEYVDETTPGSLHPQDALSKARHRAWIEFASSMGATSYQLMTSATEADARALALKINAQLQRVESQIKGPYWEGEQFSLVDAAFAPMLQRIQWCMDIAPELGCFEGVPTSQAYAALLLQRPSIARSLPSDIHAVFLDYLAGRGTPTRNTAPAWLHTRRLQNQ